jgi:hypothetical protein
MHLQILEGPTIYIAAIALAIILYQVDSRYDINEYFIALFSYVTDSIAQVTRYSLDETK